MTQRTLAIIAAVGLWPTALAAVLGSGAARGASQGAAGAAALAAAGSEAEELQHELDEVQSDNDTNEGIIDALLSKQNKLKNATVALRAKLAEPAAAKASPRITDLLQEADDLQKQVAAANEKVTSLGRELSGAREENKRLTMAVANSSSEGQSLRQKIKRTKLALLQNMQRSRDTNEEEDGALQSGAQMQLLSGRLVAKSDALDRQVRKLSERLAASQQRYHATHGEVLKAQAEAQLLKREAQLGAAARGAFLHAFADAGVSLAKDITEVHEAEVAMPPSSEVPGAVSPEAMRVLGQVQSQNQKLRQEGTDVMQKYGVLSKDYQRQREWIAALEIQQRTGRAAAAAER